MRYRFIDEHKKAWPVTHVWRSQHIKERILRLERAYAEPASKVEAGIG